jgi:hypothetical protein
MTNTQAFLFGLSTGLAPATVFVIWLTYRWEMRIRSLRRQPRPAWYENPALVPPERMEELRRRYPEMSDAQRMKFCPEYWENLRRLMLDQP